MKAEKLDAIIFGAGPAGLAAGYTLTKNNKRIAILEKESQVGGMCKTIDFKGNRFDLGGHRFFSKSREVNRMWEETLGSDFLTRSRLSRIYYKNKFFNYPVKPLNALIGLGFFESILIIIDYIRAKIHPYKNEENFKQWISNRFGKRLFNHFFKAYTEKLWGIPCDEIRAEWAAQRIKGLSLTSTIKNALFPSKNGKIKTLINKFKYPKFGPGMMYQKIASNIKKSGGIILEEKEVIGIKRKNFNIKSVIVRDKNKIETEYKAENFISSMPITELVNQLEPAVDDEISKSAEKLSYRSFITISVILKSKALFPDTWLYIHSPEVKIGRIQNFKEWSPYMISDKNITSLGLEYFCSENDELWNMNDNDLLKLGMQELEKIGLGKKKDFAEGFVTRVPKAYPVYDAQYQENIRIIKNYLAKFDNLQTIGRYGMFKYNNMDHSILTGIYAAKNILGEKHNIWSINTDQEYQEEKK